MKFYHIIIYLCNDPRTKAKLKKLGEVLHFANLAKNIFIKPLIWAVCMNQLTMIWEILPSTSGYPKTDNDKPKNIYDYPPNHSRLSLL